MICSVKFEGTTRCLGMQSQSQGPSGVYSIFGNIRQQSTAVPVGQREQQPDTPSSDHCRSFLELQYMLAMLAVLSTSF
jgi:hypothetical protein